MLLYMFHSLSNLSDNHKKKLVSLDFLSAKFLRLSCRTCALSLNQYINQMIVHVYLFEVGINLAESRVISEIS